MRVFDLHCDTIDALAFADIKDFSHALPQPAEDLAHNAELALSLERMQAAATGGWTQCFAIFVPDRLPAHLTPATFYDRALAYFKQQMSAHQDIVYQLRDARQLEPADRTTSDDAPKHRVTALLTIENGSPAEGNLGRVEAWARDGVKMVTLTWNGANCIGSGNETQAGLTRFGREVVRAMEELRMVVDVSHLNDAGFWEVARLARRPFAASHSNSRAVCGHPRNLTDDMFRAIRDAGGIVGLNYFVDFVAEHAWGQRPGSPAKEVSPEELFAHLDRWLDLDGDKSIALGSDFDGCVCPSWLAHAQDLPAFHELVAQRYGTELADQLFYNNAAAFFARNEG
ncbi:MAG: membrane dipeptidase [Coriobacteriales bacterium]|nr:membrane dipeptidase [Coriobacteriales bacterium]